MTNLKENIKYDTSETGFDTSNFPNLSQPVKKKEYKNILAPVRGNYNPQIAANLFTPARDRIDPSRDTEKKYYPADTPLSVPKEKLSEIPAYAEFLESDDQGRWVYPTEQAKGRNWPEQYGGGQYTVDPSQPDKWMKSKRVLVDDRVRKELLGDRPSWMFQIEHIVPIWAGGSDTVANLQVLDNRAHERKTAIQAVPLTLLSNGKITQKQARFMALNWADKDSKDLPSPDNRGYLPLETAEKYVQKWEEDRKKIDTAKYFKESFVEEMGKFGEGWLPDIIREPIKGFVGGATAGIVRGTGASEDSGTIAKAANVGGNIVGTILGLGKLSKILTKAPLINYGSKGGVVSKALGGEGVGKATQLANKAFKSLGFDFGTFSSLSRFTNWSKNVKDMSILFGTYNQLGMFGREMTGEEEFEFKEHVKQAGIDILYGGLFGTVSSLPRAGQSIAGYSTIGGGATFLSMAMGHSIEDSLKEGILMAALHGMGYKNRKNTKETHLEVKEKISQELEKRANTVLNDYLPNEFPVYKKGAKIPEVLSYSPAKLKHFEKIRKNNPNNKYLQQIGPVDNTVKAIFVAEVTARNKITKRYKESQETSSPMSDERYNQLLDTASGSANALRNKTLPVGSQRDLKNKADLDSIVNPMLPKLMGNDIRYLDYSSGKLKNYPTEIVSKESIPLGVKEKYDKTTQIKEGSFQTRAGGRKKDSQEKPIDPEVRDNINDVAKNTKDYDGHVYGVQSKNSRKIGELVNREYIMAGEKPPIASTKNIINLYVRKKTGEFKFVGKVPEKSAYDRVGNKYHLNRIFDESIVNFRNIFKKSESVESMIESFNKEKAFGKYGKMDPEKAKSLFEMKNEVPKMSDKELLNLVDAPNPLLELTIDNSILASKMREIGSDVLVMDIQKSSPIGKGENPQDPNLIISVTNDNLMRSMAMKGGKPIKSRGEDFVLPPYEKTVTEAIKKPITQEVKKYNSADEFAKDSPKGSLYRGTTKKEVDALLNSQQRPATLEKNIFGEKVPEGMTFTTDDISIAKNYSERAAVTRKPHLDGGYIVEYKPSVGSKSQTSISKEAGSSIIQKNPNEFYSKDISLPDVNRILDKNGKIIYEAIKETPKKVIQKTTTETLPKLDTPDVIKQDVRKPLPASKQVSLALKSKETPTKKTDIVVEYSKKPISSKTKGREGHEIAAQADHKNNKVLINEKEIQKTFEEKAWTKPKIKGVKALPKDQFKTVKEWKDFVVEHEKAHFFPEIKNLKNIALRENTANKYALNSIKSDKRSIPQNIKNILSKKGTENELLNEVTGKAEAYMSEVRGKIAQNSPKSYEMALRDSASGANTLVREITSKMPYKEQTQFIKDFGSKLDNLILNKLDNAFEGTKNLVGNPYSTKYHQYIGINPSTGKVIPVTSRVKGIKVKSSIENGEAVYEEVPVIKKKFKTEDTKLAEKYGLALKDNGYLEKSYGKPIFSEEFKQTLGKDANKTPFDFWGSELKKDFEAIKKFNTLHSRKYIQDLDKLSKTSSNYKVYAEAMKKMFDDILVETFPKKVYDKRIKKEVDNWQRKNFEKDVGGDFILNNLMKPNSFYLEKKFGTVNKEGHFISQPKDLIEAQVTGKTIKEIKKINEKTIETEQIAAKEKLKRDSQRTPEKGEKILDEGVSQEDIKGFRVRSDFQSEKVQDLTNFELRSPALLYEINTGKTPPQSAIVEDAIRNFKDLFANYIANIKPGSSQRKIFVDNKSTKKGQEIYGEGYDSIRNYFKAKEPKKVIEKEVEVTKKEEPKEKKPTKPSKESEIIKNWDKIWEQIAKNDPELMKKLKKENPLLKDF